MKKISKSLILFFSLVLGLLFFNVSSGSAATFFSCDGSSFCGAGPANYKGTLTIGSQSDSPTGKSGVWKWTFPAAANYDGSGIASIWTGPKKAAGVKELWIQYYWKYSPGFQYYPGSMNKQMYVNPSNTMSMGINPGGGISLAPQGAGGDQHFPNVDTSLWYVNPTGVWHKYKAHLVMDSYSGAWDGKYEAWVDNRKIADYSNIYYSDQTFGTNFDSPGWVVIYGGRCIPAHNSPKECNVPQEQYLYTAGMYVGDSDPGGGSGGSSCTPNWSCGNWNTCSNNQQTRTCTDSNNCGTTSGKPTTSQSCTVSASCGDNACNGTETCSSCASDCGACPIENKPGTVSNLSASSVSANSATLSFIEVNDGTGTPAKYDIRYDTSAISWGSASSVASGSCSSPLSGTTIGATKTCTVTNLNPNTQYQFQLVPYRGTLNQGAVFGDLSNVVTATTSSGTIPPRTYTIADFTNLVADWLKTISGSPADVNLDNKVNSKDLGIMMSNWKGETTTTPTPAPIPAPIPTETCGNGTCASSESCSSCPGDCGQCSSSANLISASFEDGTHSPFGSPYGGSSVVSDSTAPDGTHSLKFTYPAGLYGGVAPDLCGKNFSQTNEVWAQYRFKYSPNWRWNTIQNKQVYMVAGAQSNADVNFMIGAHSQWGDQINLMTQHNFDSTLNQSYYSRDWTLTKDVWHKVVLRVKMNTAGIKDGIAQVWVDEILRINASDVLWRRAGQSTGWSNFQMTPVYGGGKEQIPETQYMWFDDIIVSKTAL